MKSYLIKKYPSIPEFTPEAWDGIAAVKLDCFRPESSSHRPETTACAIHDGKGMAVFFEVNDRFIRLKNSRHNQPVCEDSCVEFFFAPFSNTENIDYFNFECSASGVMLCGRIMGRRLPDGSFENFRLIDEENCRDIRMNALLSGPLEEEITRETKWHLGLYIPFDFFRRQTEREILFSGRAFRGNFYKCADRSSHPHWGSWSPVNELNFHMPECFGELIFQ